MGDGPVRLASLHSVNIFPRSNPYARIHSLRRDLTQVATDNFSLGFDRYQPQRQAVLSAFTSLLSRENLQSVLFPRKPLRSEELGPLEDRVKNKKTPLEELNDFGVIPLHALVKPAGDDRGGNDEFDVYLFASLYVLPASPPLAKRATLKPEKYKDLKPHVLESFVCHPSPGLPGYYVKFGGWGITGAMAIRTEDPSENFGHFHLAPSCKNSAGQTHQTENVFHVDGMKIYLPVRVQEEEGWADKTVVLSASIVVMGGVVGWTIRKFGSPEKSALAYGLGGLSEMAMVLRDKSQRQNPRAAK